MIYVAHPLNAPTEAERIANLDAAECWVRWFCAAGLLAFAPWVALARGWPESMREAGIKLDKVFVGQSRGVFLCGPRISDGMRIEAEHAFAWGIPVRDFTSLGRRYPPQEPCSKDVLRTHPLWSPLR